ncbi:MAG: hypothetical protein KatS3mg060_1455 [Dehalococcoidia bacterium]|nr:MAG: hypothetical protein KatS3mg060_1455 [Dehalococcoidia bacterium]
MATKRKRGSSPKSGVATAANAGSQPRAATPSPSAGAKAQRSARRSAARQRAQNRHRLWWIAAAAVLAVVAGIGIWQIVQPKPADGATWYPSEGAQHVPNGTELTYSSYPPASGPHYPSAAPAGFYRQPVPEGNWVHSLEHGYVVVLYKPDLPADQITQLEEISLRLPNSKWGRRKIIMAPYERMDSPITAVAWQYKLPLSRPDEEAIRRFYVNRVDQGPEDVP